MFHLTNIVVASMGEATAADVSVQIYTVDGHDLAGPRPSQQLPGARHGHGQEGPVREEDGVLRAPGQWHREIPGEAAEVHRRSMGRQCTSQWGGRLMGAREDLLGAARDLTRQGRTPFSPVELIAAARARDSNYPESTLRTFIVGPMCVNSPDNHAVQYGDLCRVARGLYRLANDDSPIRTKPPVPVPVAPVSPEEPSPPESPVDATAEWWWEGNVQAAVVRHLAAEGWDIHRVAGTSSRERGVDIDAVRGGERLLVEVKGYPSGTYLRGPKEGQRKSTSAPLQARTYFAGALLSGLLMRADHPSARVILALPDVETYRTLAARTSPPLIQARVELWLVSEGGTVSEISKDAQSR
jgi:hypothetical protein